MAGPLIRCTPDWHRVLFIEVMKKSKDHKRTLLRKEVVEVRPDLQDAERGKDLSYLNEMPQMGGYEGVKAGSPPKKDKRNAAPNKK